jgi:hypothetical protein
MTRWLVKRETSPRQRCRRVSKDEEEEGAMLEIRNMAKKEKEKAMR